MKSKFIKFFALIFAIIISISCGNEITPPENDNESGTVIVIDKDKTYTVRLGSIVTNIKPSDMTNAWKYYIGGKKLSTGNNWRFEKDTGNYWEDSYSKTSQRATLVGAAIKKGTDGETYLMGIYYNNKILGEGFSQYMLIYIQADGQERGYYGGGSDKNKKPDYSTVWTHYKASMGVDPLGILKETSTNPVYTSYIIGNEIISFADNIPDKKLKFQNFVKNRIITNADYYFTINGLGNIKTTKKPFDKIPAIEQYRRAIYFTNNNQVYLGGVYCVNSTYHTFSDYRYKVYCIDKDFNLLVFGYLPEDPQDRSIWDENKFLEFSWNKININLKLQ